MEEILEKWLINNLKKLPLSKIIDFFDMETMEESQRKVLKEFICQNFEKKPVIRLRDSIEKLAEEKIHHVLKSKIMTARYCAEEILERLGDLGDINTLSDIEVIITQQIKTSKNFPLTWEDKDQAHGEDQKRIS